MAQGLEAVSVIVVVGGLSYAFFKGVERFKLLRSEPAHELHGLDLPEMGVPGYTNVDVLDAWRQLPHPAARHPPGGGLAGK
ncbi:MAG: ammonium transporter [Anaerolineae bacterium]|nr:ammonium transporter [Anaerolineae bacterium]